MRIICLRRVEAWFLLVSLGLGVWLWREGGGSCYTARLYKSPSKGESLHSRTSWGLR